MFQSEHLDDENDRVLKVMQEEKTFTKTDVSFSDIMESSAGKVY